MLNGTNFKDWKDNVLIGLSCLDLDLAIRVTRLTIIDASSVEDKKELEKVGPLKPHECYDHQEGHSISFQED